MNKYERIKMVKAMEFIARQVNDEDVFQYWLANGVADGDIEYGDLEVNPEDEMTDVCFYIGEENVEGVAFDAFEDLMSTFLKLMVKAWKSGGLYCDGVTSDCKARVEG